MKLFDIKTDRAAIEAVASRAEYAALLVPSPRRAYIEAACAAARRLGFAAVLATPFDCPAVLRELEGSGVETVCMNAMNHALDENLDCRLAGTKILLAAGVRNFELAVPVGMLRDSKFDGLKAQLAALTEKIHAAGGRAGVILEPEQMEREAMAHLIDTAVGAQADWIRLCSGFGEVCGTEGGRTTVNTLCFALERSAGRLPVKAGGGWDYSYLEDCAEYIDCGAARVDAGPRFAAQLDALGYRRDAL